MTIHYPITKEVIVFDTTDDDMTVLPATIRTEVQERCGCEDSLAHTYGEPNHKPTEQEQER